MNCKWLVSVALALAAGPVGCRKTVRFPRKPMPPVAGAHRAYDVDGDGSADFFLLADAGGRVRALGYDNDDDARPDATIDLDAIRFGQCRHLVIILDGFDYETLSAFYRAGGLRVFHPPSRVVAPYPGLTDLCMEDILGYVPYVNMTTRALATLLDGKGTPVKRLLADEQMREWFNMFKRQINIQI